MIRKIRIQGFKSIVDTEIELGQVNVFIGPNGVGKTNLLEAIGVLGAAVEGAVDDASLSRRGVRWGLPALYKVSLQDIRFRRVITLEAVGGDGPQGVLYRVGLDNPIEKPRPSWQYTTENLQVGGTHVLGRGPGGMRFGQGAPSEKPRPEQGYVRMAYLYLPEEGVEVLEALRSFVIFTPLTPMLRGIQPDPMPLSPLGLSGGGFTELLESLLNSPQGEKVVRHLQEMVDWVEKVEVLPPTKARIPPALPTTRRVIVFTARRMRRGRNQITAYDASEGVLYVLFTLALALHPNLPPFLAVDNFGYGMHPWLVRKLTSTFCKLLLEESPRRQVLLTTHDPMVLDGLPLFDPGVRLFAVERDSKGATTVRPIAVTEEARKLKEEHGLVLSDLWLQGWLGAVPVLF
jgi:energy-coupling factor transporter ATP-binding protein EcfA2